MIVSDIIYIISGCVYSLLFVANIYVFPFDNHHIVMAIPILKAGHFFGDLASGILHYIMDTFDFKILKNIHFNFRNHHKNSLSLDDFSLIENIFEITPIGIPLFILNLFISNYTHNLFISDINALLIITNIIACSSQIAHRMAHCRKRLYLPYIVKVLQDYNIILNPKHHRIHHTTEIMNYCIANGTASAFLDKIIDFFNLPVSIYNNAGGIYTILDKQQRLLYKEEKEKKYT